MRETSVILFHGPNAPNICVSEAEKYGKQIRPPMGTEGLTRQEAREIVEILMSPTVGGPASLVIGPLDEATPGTTDILLKLLEEPKTGAPKMFLWVRDLGAVAPTIRSRCLHRWCPGVESLSDLAEAAQEMVGAISREEIASIIFLVFDYKGREEDLLRECVRVVSEVSFEDRSMFSFWVRARKLLRISNTKLTQAQVVSCFLPVNDL